jgi:flavin-dependent dehydrogenase
MFANLGALHLRRRLPKSAEIVVIGPESRGGMPVVGESTIEITAQFLENRLGLGPYLRDHHYPKYGLTYYFKLDPDNPADRRYSVHSTERGQDSLLPLEGGWSGPMARPPSWQLNRTVFDRDLRRFVDEAGVGRIHAMLRGIALDGQNGHTLTIEHEDGTTTKERADWIVDATGRRSVLGRQLGLRLQSEIQRDVFWFRLSNFDRKKLLDLEWLGPTAPGPASDYHYDEYFATHHFMGRGHWIWMIPLRSPDKDELISIGISTRCGVYPGSVRTMDEFMAQVATLHPVITDLVKTGHVEDTNVYRKFHYNSKQAYSADRWAIVGDAAFTPDALFSNGLAFGVIQLDQVGEMIARDCERDHDPGYIQRLERALWPPLSYNQWNIGYWYETMGDAYLSSFRVTWTEMGYFYVLLPLVTNGAHYDPAMMPAWEVLQVPESRVRETDLGLIPQVVAARKLFEKARPEHFIYRGKIKINPRATTRVKSLAELIEHVRTGALIRQEYLRDVIAQVAVAERMVTKRAPEINL